MSRWPPTIPLNYGKLHTKDGKVKTAWGCNKLGQTRSMLWLIHYIVAAIAAESPARIIAAVLYPHYTTSQHITHNNQT